MLKYCLILSVAAVLVASCAGKQKQAPPPGMMAATNAPFAAILFSGDVKAQVVPWVEGITLAQALIAAQYTGFWDPHSITVTRNGIPYKVDVKKFLRGDENPEMQAGDSVEVRR